MSSGWGDEMRRNVIALLVAVGLVSGIVIVFRPSPDPPAPPPSGSGPRLVWTFEAPRPGFVVATPTVSPEAVFLAVGHVRGFQQLGAVYAIDPGIGKTRWMYDRDGEMLAAVSTPLLANGRLYFGEGLHNNFSCRLHCLDARTGLPSWTVPTGDHIEGGPSAAGNLVLFSAGNDGLHAVDARTGLPAWNFRADLHIDSTPLVLDGRVYAGSGSSRRFPSLQVISLDARTGNPVWRTPVPLPAWGSPVVANGRVFFGLGNGRLTEKAASPAGGLACIDAATGAEIWTFRVGDAVFGRPAVADNRVVFGSRDGNLYGLTFEGIEVFRVPLGGPVMAPPATDGEHVYAIAVPGRIVCIRAADGTELWRYELSQRGAVPQAYAGPAVSGRRLYVASEMMSGPVGIVCLHCFELPESNVP